MMSVMNNSEDFELGILVKVDDDVSNIVGIDFINIVSGKILDESSIREYLKKKAVSVYDTSIRILISNMNDSITYHNFDRFLTNNPNHELLSNKLLSLAENGKDYSKWMKNYDKLFKGTKTLSALIDDISSITDEIDHLSSEEGLEQQRAINNIIGDLFSINADLLCNLPGLLGEVLSNQFDLAGELLKKGNSIIINHLEEIETLENDIQRCIDGEDIEFDFDNLDEKDIYAQTEEIDEAIEAYRELRDCYGLLSPELEDSFSDAINRLETQKREIIETNCALNSLKRDIKAAKEEHLFFEDSINVELLTNTYNNTLKNNSELLQANGGEDTPLYGALLNSFLSSYDSGYCSLTDEISILYNLRDNLNNASGAVYDPILLDLNGNGYEIERKSSGAYFDLNCDGFAERINWTTKDAILAVDKNGNGIIDDGNEVFGDFFVLENGQRARNGFEALSQFDSNNDGLIDENDASFDDLLLWIDSNGNGISEEGELSSLSSHNIKSISLDYTTVNASTSSEAIIGNQSVFTYTNDVQNTLGEMWASADLFDSMEKGFENNTGFDTDSPNVRSFGKVNSLRTAIELDETGSLAQMVESFITSTQREERYQLVESILEKMCHAETIDINSRGSNINARHLAVIEAVFGEDFVGVNGANPNPVAAEILNETYKTIVDLYYFSMSANKLNKYVNLIDFNSLENTYDLSIFSNVVTFSIKTGLIDDGTLKDICSYLDLISLTEKMIIICLWSLETL